MWKLVDQRTGTFELSCLPFTGSSKEQSIYTHISLDIKDQFSSVAQSCPTLCDSLWAVARQASLSVTNFRNLLKLMSITSVMPSNHLILCRPLLLLPSIFPSIRVFSNKSVLHIRWPKYWSFSFSISPSNEYEIGVFIGQNCLLSPSL